MNRATKIIGAIVLTPVVLVAGYYVASGLTGTVHLAKAKRQAVTDVETALPSSDAEAQRQQQRLRTVVGGAPAYSWRELDCELESNDAGWMVQDWEQDCEVRAVELFPVSSARPGTCQRVEDPGAAAASYRTQIARGQTASVTAPLGAHTWCPDGISSPPAFGVSRVIAGARPTDLSASPAWVVAESRTPVSRTTLGCNPWGVLFCTQPVGGPVMG